MAEWFVETHLNIQPLFFFQFHGQGAEKCFSANNGLLIRFLSVTLQFWCFYTLNIGHMTPHINLLFPKTILHGIRNKFWRYCTVCESAKIAMSQKKNASKAHCSQKSTFRHLAHEIEKKKWLDVQMGFYKPFGHLYIYI